MGQRFRARHVVVHRGDIVTRQWSADLICNQPRFVGQVQHDPAFIGPMSKRRETATSTGRFGVAGWVSPNTPVGSPNSGWNEVSGYFALGFSITWDGPPPVRRTAPAAP